jgi:trehalose-6-phosphate synthase
LYIVAARLPVEYDAIEGWRRAPGGLVSALEPTLSEVTAWFGEGRAGQPSPPARVDRCELIALPVSAGDRELAHDGFCNRTLWPALHGIGGNIEQRRSWWEAWRRHNVNVAETVARTAAPGAAVWVHDYHHFGLAAPLRRRRRDLRVGLSCHTPIVEQVLSRLTQARALARDLADFALIGAQTERDRAQVVRWLDRARIPVTRRPDVITNPVGLDVEAWVARRRDAVVVALADRHRAPSGVLVAGVDRVDYTKGLLHKLHAVEVLLARGQVGSNDVRFVQIAVPSRTSIPLYGYLRRQMEEAVERINADFPRDDGRPVVTLIQEQLAPRQVAGLMRAADIALVTPARDGMNLVALEFAIINGDRPCELILSRGTGAADHIGRWCRLVDGTDVNGIVDAITGSIAACGTSESADRARRRAAAASALTTEQWSRTFLEHLLTAGRDASSDRMADRLVGW